MGNTSKHTPGPWARRGGMVDGYCIISESTKELVAPNPISSPNANLIAAAPAMYEALQQLVKVEQLRTQATLDNDYVDLVLADQQLQTLAQAALAQADGEGILP